MKAIYKNYFRKNTNKDPIIKALENIPIFDNLSDKDLEKISRLTHEREYKKEEQIFKKLAPAEGMYVILDGEVIINDFHNHPTNSLHIHIHCYLNPNTLYQYANP